MKRDVIRRRRTTSFRMIACVHHRRDSGGDGRARTAILVAQAIDGGVPGRTGTERVGNRCWPSSLWMDGLWRHCCHGGWAVMGVAALVEEGIQSGLGDM